MKRNGKASKCEGEVQVTKKKAGTELTGKVICGGERGARGAGGKRKTDRRRGAGCKRGRRLHRL